MEAHEPLIGCPDGAGGLFPFASAREGQRQFLEDARSCVRNRVNLVAHAPTGLGKTAVALTAALETTLQEDGLVIFMTSRQSQHNAAIETARRIWRVQKIGVVDLISREDMCLCRRKGEVCPCLSSDDCYFLDEKRISDAAVRLLDYPLHVTEAQRMCLRAGACPWRSAIRSLADADVVVCDYNHLFSPTDGPMFDRAGREMDRCVLIVDEAHGLPTRIVEACSSSLSRATLLSASRSIKDRSARRALQAMLRQFDVLCFGPQREIAAEELETVVNDECGMFCQGLSELIYSSLKKKARGPLEKVAMFLRAWNANGSSSFRYADPSTGELHCRFMEPWLVAQPVFEKMRSSIVMSGTLHPPEMFADLLGIGDMSACRRYRSPFDPSNRNILAVKDVTSRYEQRGKEMYARMASRLMEISDAVEGNVAAFFPSYEMLGSVEAEIRKQTLCSRLLVERRGMARSERDAMLVSLRQDERAVLLANISGSFAEGVDFYDNVLSAVAVVGWPLSPPSIVTEEMVRRLSARFGHGKAECYVKTYPAVAKVLQAAGRAIRGEQDRASIVLMDDRYASMAVRGAFPEDFCYKVSEDLVSDLRAFHHPESGTKGPEVKEGDAEKGY